MKTDHLKICFVTSSYPRSADDPAAVFLRHLANRLIDHRLRVHVLAPADGADGTKIENNVTLHRFHYFPARWQSLAYGSGILPNLRRRPWLWIQVPFFLASMFFSLLRLVRTERPDIIHAHWIVPAGLVAVASKYFHKVPVIVTAHGSDAFALQSKFVRRLKRYAITRSTAWTANTRATANAIGTMEGAATPRIVPMGIDVEFFARGSSEPRRRELGGKEFLILFVGRLVESKGCHDLVQALSLLSQSIRPKTALWIVGDGNERPRLEKQAASLGLTDAVRFWGALPNHRLPDFYSAAEVFVAPSIQMRSGEAEGQNIAILEAAAARACVIASRVGGIEEIVTDGATGILVAPEKPHELARAIERVLLDATERARLEENAFARVTERYDWKRIAGEFAELYRLASSFKK